MGLEEVNGVVRGEGEREGEEVEWGIFFFFLVVLGVWVFVFEGLRHGDFFFFFFFFESLFFLGSVSMEE